SLLPTLKDSISSEETSLVVSEARSSVREGSVEDIAAANLGLVDLLASSIVLAMTTASTGT
ncbi:hypothetical protein SARC_12672, partial [Sphaeroforma arctica JP610]